MIRIVSAVLYKKVTNTKLHLFAYHTLKFTDTGQHTPTNVAAELQSSGLRTLFAVQSFFFFFTDILRERSYFGTTK